MVSEAPRPSVVMSLVSCDTPWKPATIAIAPASMAASIRPGVMSMIRALPCAESVITPACEPVNERALWPRLAIAIASSAIEIRSPAVSSMSSSRGGGVGLTCSARSRSSSVLSPIADDHDDRRGRPSGCRRCARATRLMPSASATEEPPYFCTTMLIRALSRPADGRRRWGRGAATGGRVYRGSAPRPDRGGSRDVAGAAASVGLGGALTFARRPPGRLAGDSTSSGVGDHDSRR